MTLPVNSFLRYFSALFTTLLLVASTMTSASAQGKMARYGEFAAEPAVIDHSAFNSFLQTYVSESADGRTILNYAGVSSEDRRALQDYLEVLEDTDPATLTKAQAYAYWVNLYNALTVEVILDRYPLDSIRDISFGLGPWGKKLVRVSGKKISLNNIEHDILRVFWSDPRTHYAVNCASFGCPNLQAVAFTAENTEELLEKGAREYVNHPRGVSVDDNGDVTVSSIYNWYQVDFGDSAQGVLDHVRIYAEPELAAKLEGKTKIDGYDYDWALNNQ